MLPAQLTMRLNPKLPEHTIEASYLTARELRRHFDSGSVNIVSKPELDEAVIEVSEELYRWLSDRLDSMLESN